MLIQSKEILRIGSSPFMVLEKHSFDKAKAQIRASYLELIEKIDSENASHTWGYFPGLEKDEESKYPACIRLSSHLKENLLTDSYAHQLAFIRAATAKPISDFGGMHIDVDVGIGHTLSPEHSKENIIRTLINLFSTTRRLQYIPFEADFLRKKGVNIPHNRYSVIDCDGLEIKEIEIPPIEKNAIWVLKFYSNIIPHAGLTGDEGHFLAAYGAYVEKQLYAL